MQTQFKVQGRDFGAYLTTKELKLVRTYKGEINRTQTGKVASFPTSFVTVGFDVVLVGPRNIMNDLEQIFLSADLVEIIFDYEGTSLKGKFSATTNSAVELKDKAERSKQLSVSIVSDGAGITKADGTKFTVVRGSTTLLTDCYFGKVYSITGGTAYKLNGANLPADYRTPTKGSLLVLGDTTLT